MVDRSLLPSLLIVVILAIACDDNSVPQPEPPEPVWTGVTIVDGWYGSPWGDVTITGPGGDFWFVLPQAESIRLDLPVGDGYSIQYRPTPLGPLWDWTAPVAFDVRQDEHHTLLLYGPPTDPQFSE